MANSAAGGPGDHNSEIIKEFRANQGRAGGMWKGTTPILIHPLRPTSRIEPLTPPACSPQPAGGARSAPPTAGRRVAEGGRGVPWPGRSPGQDHSAVSGVHADAKDCPAPPVIAARGGLPSPPRRSPPTDGSAPATWPAWTTVATWPWSTGPQG